MQHDATDGLFHPDSELDQSLAKRGDLRACAGGSCRMSSQRLHEHEGGRGHENSKLVGQETCAARPIDLEAVVKLLDPVFDVAPLAVDVLVEGLRRVGEVGDDESRVVFRQASFQSDDLRFEDNAPAPVPALRGVTARAVEVLGLSAAF